MTAVPRPSLVSFTRTTDAGRRRSPLRRARFDVHNARAFRPSRNRAFEIRPSRPPTISNPLVNRPAYPSACPIAIVPVSSDILHDAVGWRARVLFRTSRLRFIIRFCARSSFSLRFAYRSFIRRRL